MVKIENTERTYAIYIRTNKRVQWKFAHYEGRWSSPEEAVKMATERHPDISFEYQIDQLGGDGIIQGEVKHGGK
jgi:phosphoribosylformylglycinamidine (FGAM) synthase-like amidotransferase family enzyme